MFQYVLFDLDGTLTDPKTGITSCVQYALADAGIEEPDLDKLELGDVFYLQVLDKLEPFIGPPLTDSFREFYGFDDEQIKRAIDKYHERFDEKGIFENELIEGIPELLKALKDAGRRVSIASSKPRPLVIRILEHFEIAQYFDTVVGSEFDGRFATKEAVVEEALKQLVPSVYEKEDVAMVGDRKFDIQGARAHGLTGIGVSFGYAGEHELEDAGADYIVDTVEELQRLLLQGSL